MLGDIEKELWREDQENMCDMREVRKMRGRRANWDLGSGYYK